MYICLNERTVQCRGQPCERTARNLFVWQNVLEYPACRSRGRRPLIAGSWSLQRLGVDLFFCANRMTGRSIDAWSYKRTQEKQKSTPETRSGLPRNPPRLGFEPQTSCHSVSVRRFPSFRTQPLENLTPLPMKQWTPEQPSPWRKSSKRESCDGDRGCSNEDGVGQFYECGPLQQPGAQFNCIIQRVENID